MKKVGKCVRCGRVILDNEDYIKVGEFLSGEKNREELYHKECFHEGMKTKRMKDVLFARTMGILNKAEERLV